MKTFLKVVGGLFAGLVLLLLLTGVAARLSDGPIAIFAGGPFASGELVTGPEPDWSAVHDVDEVEFQLLEPPRSRTTWIVEHEGRIFIPSGYMTTAVGKIWKKWPLEALEDGRAILRVGDKLYERQLVRIEDGPLVAPVTAELGRKYIGSEVPLDSVSSGSLWLFELAPRT